MLERFMTQAWHELDNDPEHMTWRALCLYVLIGYGVGLGLFGSVIVGSQLVGWSLLP